jgi:hypothetical protein
MGVVYDSGIPGVAFKLDVRMVALNILKTLISAVSITFTDKKYIDTMIYPN